MHHTEKKMRSLLQVRIYQSRRVYLDEYEKQEELREEYFMERPILIFDNEDDCITIRDVSDVLDEWLKSERDYTLTFTTIDDDTITVTCSPAWEDFDPYFYNRWIKRN